MTFASSFCKKGHCIHILWCIFMGLGHNDPWVDSHIRPQQMWGQRSSWGQWPLVQVFAKTVTVSTYFDVCSGETRGSRTTCLWFKHMFYAGFRLTCCSLLCRYAAWSLLAVSELQLSAATPLWLFTERQSLPSWIEFNCLRSAAVDKAARLSIYWLDAACRLVIPLRQVTLVQLN